MTEQQQPQLLEDDPASSSGSNGAFSDDVRCFADEDWDLEEDDGAHLLHSSVTWH
eukprot:m.81952 g.81952  ORF g.81952 m.81952 type:complete len:55 (-) comp14709_c0_seq1:1081-1245(-)